MGNGRGLKKKSWSSDIGMRLEKGAILRIAGASVDFRSAIESSEACGFKRLPHRRENFLLGRGF